MSRGSVNVPDVVGREAATTPPGSCDDLGLKVQTQEDPNATQNAGVVTRQSPGSGQVAIGSTITITISTRPAVTPTTPTPTQDSEDPDGLGGLDGGDENNGG